VPRTQLRATLATLLRLHDPARRRQPVAP
jgi:hypothetical protein